MSSSDATIIEGLNNATIELNRYFSIIIYIFGIAGNILNCLVLLQRPLRTNSCAFCFLVASCSCFIEILAGLTSRVMVGWSAATDLSGTIGWICKLRGFLIYTSRTTTFWIIVLATFDRWLLSSRSANRRQLSTLKNVQRSIIIIIFLSSIFYIQILVCIEANLIDAPIPCYLKTGICRLLPDVSFVLVTTLFPIILMVVFGLLTISNLHQAQHRVQPTNSAMTEGSTSRREQQQRLQKTDHHLRIMLFVQVFLLTLFTIPYTAQIIYVTITENFSKSPLQNAIENLIFNFNILLMFVVPGMPFYIYTLSGGSVFREAILKLMQQMKRKIMCQCE